MLATFLTTFREGLEALLIIVVALTFLRKTNNHKLVPPLLYGTFVAVALAIALGYYLAEYGTFSPVWEGLMALVAAVLIVLCVVHMIRHGKKMGEEIRTKLQALTEQESFLIKTGIFTFALLMVGREGIEAATLIAVLASFQSKLMLLLSACGGVLAAVSVAMLWAKFGKHINVSLVFKITGIFLMLFAIQLFIYAFHEFSEANILPGLDNAYWHEMTEPLGPDGTYGVWLSYSLLIIPLAMFAWSYLKNLTSLKARS
ncbi:MAG: FTR1 family protein [Methylophilus sp.]|nr:FTR1 family protein [Methylophilus sp.]